MTFPPYVDMRFLKQDHIMSAEMLPDPPLASIVQPETLQAVDAIEKSARDYARAVKGYESQDLVAAYLAGFIRGMYHGSGKP